jgi:arabinofuranosyltransferase
MSFFSREDLLPRYVTELPHHLPAAAAGVLVALALTLPATRRWLQKLPALGGVSRVRLVLLVATLALGLTWAWKLLWACDDAYISFRYAANMLDGHGLVWNVGERVEGYTNFLWLIIVSPFMALGIDAGQASVILNLVCFACVLLLSARLERLLLWPGNGQGPGGADPQAGRRAPAIAPLLAATCYPMACFATSGLETIFITLMALVAVERALARRYFVAGLAAIAGVMAHPDQAILYVALGLTLLTFRPRLRPLLAYGAPFVLVYLPYFLIRWRYYGDFYPNTYYAKSADLTNWPQGFTYLGIAFVTAGLWATTPAALLGLRRIWSTLPGRYALIATPLFLGYVAKIGGDFMQGRLLVPMLPLWFVLAGVGLQALLAAQRWKLAAALAVLAVPAALPVNIFGDGERLWNVTEEHAYYPLLSFNPPVNRSKYQRQGKVLRARFKDRGLEPRIALAGVGLVSYYSRLPITDLLSLNDRKTAHRPVMSRGMPGHEKHAGPARIVESGAVMSLFSVYPPPFEALTHLDLDGFDYFFTRWDPSIMPTVRLPPAGRFTDIVAHLRETASALEGPGHTSPAADELGCLLWFADSYYLAHNDDPQTRAAMTSVAAMDPGVRGAEALVLTGGEKQTGATRVKSFGFSPAEWPALRQEGDAFGKGPLTEAPAGQQEIFGYQGPFASSFPWPGGDGPTGTLRLPWTVEGDVLTFRIGGGRDPQRLRVSLVVDGKAVASATGCNSELLGRRAWNVRPYHGKQAVLEIVDASSGGWGHLMVDELEEWRLP